MVVVDTNVLAYLLIAGDRTAAAQALFARDADWRSDGFILVELSNILATYVRDGGLTRDRALAMLADAERLMPGLEITSNARALDVALRFGIAAYDGRFIAFAMQSGRRLVTEDVRLRRAAPDWTISLGDAVRA